MSTSRLHEIDEVRKNPQWLAFVALATVGLVTVLALLLWPPHARKPLGGQPPATDDALVVAPLSPNDPLSRGSPIAPSPSPPEPAPVIDEVQIERTEVCSGEENLVTVRAHTVNGTNEFLHYVIDGQMGSSVPLRLTLGDRGEVVGQHFIRVFGKNNSEVTVPLPKYRVKDCQPTHIVLVEQRVRANSQSDFEFLARIVNLPARGADKPGPVEPFLPVSYSWTFGDGSTDVTSVPVASHSYERRVQDTLYSYYTIRVEIRDSKGAKLAGRTSIPLINPAFEAFAQKKIVQLLIALEPRFPRLDSDGRVFQKVRLWHTRPESVRIDGVVKVEYFESGAGERPPQAVDPAKLLGTTTIPPGSAGVVTEVELDTLANPGVLSITYQLRGRSADSYPVMGSFSVMKPPPRPTPDNSEPVVDPRLEAKIVAAREILHQEVVSDDDLWRLQREGRFAQLTSQVSPPNASSSPPGASPPGMPGPGHVTNGPPVPTAATAPPGLAVMAEPGGPTRK